ncbi:hypothetical protein A2130_04300 [Candidatus Woesebacteria bacterium GWC2_33_12]|uniref:DUF86 domain-containing protein n=1 Tax=Candidatus Woesebacteria bacterium GW2011_GWB1_33_22 TaxID=1618566 RepID=A0A0F9ZZB8_9BACT|nr:MAG: hypothetical protein UR29_C0015G0012 [Candidatus Woesebacteria bacterium GW2011_GWC2_33_12]KKP44306.1 MAG: hypothetical protein UR35_C0009G0017 [Candidatus Woesebacteria bacterium GW2011_GWB1_33_22]KKP46064.1 MAG: hypothetical protein UR37_C0012G0016 [Microgenomates group bacterium GW2011_GWC1_33_28]KKP49953.1 MAG: hypothetical protein UR41_C0011G0015 [Candidatus Woesebacteria bacterium GW2011_GWA1_33_33]OGM07011.1 MAG: hypothetical protein A2130_04300 [Candidatus Woesebacteria bacteriu
MTNLKLEKDIILKRIEGIEGEIKELQLLKNKPFDEFKSGDSWKLAQFHLHRALEGVFNIGNHILSRIPGATATQYKEIAVKLTENKIIPNEFTEKLVEMAKYRNRIVHFYAQITPEELYKLINDDLGDFDGFLSAIKKVLLNPADFSLEVD